MLRLDLNNLVVLAHVAFVVDERQLKADAGIEVVEEVAPVLKNGGLVVCLCKLIVNIFKGDGL